MDQINKSELLLTQLVLMFQTAALQQMGKLKNPMTDKIEVDLSQAQISIDILDMIYTKMKGNLSKEEERMLSVVLQELRLNYVDETLKQKQPDTGKTTASTTTDTKPQL
jgi:hypothetical protein